jgi:hypothetical protein
MRRGSALLLTFVCALVSCSSTEPNARPTRSPGQGSPISEAYPYTEPTPPAEPTVADGTYSRTVTEKEAGGAGPCRRCPPYRLEEARSTLSLQAGVFRITNEVREAGAIDWRSVGHYTVSGNEIVFFNDPNCPQTRGTYTWTATGALLAFEVADDDCAFGGLRWRYLTALPWTVISI